MVSFINALRKFSLCVLENFVQHVMARDFCVPDKLHMLYYAPVSQKETAA